MSVVKRVICDRCQKEIEESYQLRIGKIHRLKEQESVERAEFELVPEIMDEVDLCRDCVHEVLSGAMLFDVCQQLMDAAEEEDTADDAEDDPEEETNTGPEESKEEPTAEEPGQEEPVKAEKQGPVKEEPVKEEPPTAKGGRKIDVGSVYALYEAGWMPEEIAADQHCSVAAVYYHLDKKYPRKKGTRK